MNTENVNFFLTYPALVISIVQYFINDYLCNYHPTLYVISGIFTISCLVLFILLSIKNLCVFLKNILISSEETYNNNKSEREERREKRRKQESLETIQKRITYCKYAKYVGLTSCLLGIGLALNSQEDNFTKLASSFALVSAFLGIISEAILELVLKPKKKEIKRLSRDFTTDQFRKIGKRD